MAVDGGYGPKGYPKFDPLGAPELNVDDEAVGQYAALVGNRKVGTAAQRAALVSTTTAANQAWVGLEFVETDTGLTYVCTDASPLTWVVDDLASFTKSGSGSTGILTPAATNAFPRKIEKYGQWQSFTTATLGHEYASIITFPQAFPNACVNVTITQIQQTSTDSGTALAYDGGIALDIVEKTRFRVFYKGGTVSTQRAFLWTAVGY